MTDHVKKQRTKIIANDINTNTEHSKDKDRNTRINVCTDFRSDKCANVQVNVSLDPNKGKKDKNVNVDVKCDGESISKNNCTEDLTTDRGTSDTCTSNTCTSDDTSFYSRDDENQRDDGKKNKYTTDEISLFISRIQNKYSGNAEQKHLNQMYDIGVLIVNKNFNKTKLIEKLTKIIEERSKDSLKKVREYKKIALMDALNRGIDDAMSDEYRCAYDNSNRYQYDRERLKKRAHIDSVLDHF